MHILWFSTAGAMRSFRKEVGMAFQSNYILEQDFVIKC